MRKIALLFLVVFVTISCSSDALSVKKATSLINDFTRQHPVYESESIHLGERKLRIQKDKEEIDALKKLESESFISLKTNELRKKLWSKDSIWDVTITLTSDASKYVIDQRKNKAEVKTYLFTIQEKSDVALKLNTKTKATAKAKLIKEPTPFAALSKDRNPHSEFITRDFTLKFRKETGWYVQK
ncbi:MAG TPA: hypothetical protein VKY82_06950 [Flavobacterium sp.]|nr:hypothetical protein [Flavobacterium sp.]